MTQPQLQQDFLKQLDINPGMSRHELATEVAKALGYGAVTTDTSLLTQGGALTLPSLDEMIVTMRTEKKDFERYHEIKVTKAPAIQDQWVENYALGGSQGATISDMSGSTKEATSSFRRRTGFVKFFATVTSIEKAVVSQPNFLGDLTMQDEQAYTRVISDHSWMIYEGGAGPDEYRGAAAIAESPDDANWDGEHVADLMSNSQGYSGLDGNGFTNPADIETAVRNLARVIGRPVNGRGLSPFVHVGPSTYEDIQSYKNFEPVSIQSNTAEGRINGNVITGFANPYAGAIGDVRMTRIQADQFLPDHGNEWDIAPELRREPQADPMAPKPTVTAAPVSAVDSRFTADWAGTYEYFVVPAGRKVGKDHYYGTAAALQSAVAVSAGEAVKLTIKRAPGGQEDIYNIYRGRRNSAGGLSDARLMVRIPATGSETTFIDLNRDLPGASKAYVMDVTDPTVMDFRELFAPYRIELPINQHRVFNIPMAVVDARYLRVRKTRHIGVIKNILNSSTGWKARGD